MGLPGPPGPAAAENYVMARGVAGPLTCVGNGSFALAPYNHTVSITSTGGPIVVHAAMRQNKTGTCSRRGHLTLRVNGALLIDPDGLGMASTYECNAVATLSQPLALPAGTHTIELMAMGEAGDVCSYGTFDYLLAWEVP